MVNLYPMGQIIEDTKSLLPTITEVTCTPIRRQANNLVHRSARYGLSVDYICVCSGNPPIFVVDT